MGLIYVNPEGPNGDPDPLAAARDIRETFARMAMNDEETVALIVGGHTFGKTHGAVDPKYLGPEPEAAPIEQQGLGWKNSFGNGNGVAHAHERAGGCVDEGAGEVGQRLPREPVRVRLGADGEPRRGKAVDAQEPRGPGHRAGRSRSVQAPRADDADDGPRAAGSIRSTSRSRRRFYENPDQLAEAFAKAWYKLLHRDMGPISRYLGPWIPEAQLWQDPVPAVDHELIDEADVAALKQKILASGLSISRLVSTAWAAASSFRGTDKRGGANGARIRLAPQKDWEVNEPAELASTLQALEQIQQDFNSSQSDGKQVSLADLIVLGGCAAVEQAAKNAGHDDHGPVRAGTHRRFPGADRRGVVRRARADRRRLPQLLR